MARGRAPLYRNALVLLGNSGLTAGLGFVFWTLAARLYPPAQVGLASAAISSALFMATLSQLGLPYALVSFSPAAGAGRAAFTWTVVLVVAVGSAIAGGIFIAGLDVWAAPLAQLASPPILAVGVIVLAAATGTFTVLVYAAIGTRDARPALAGGVTHGLVKSALILVFAVAFAPVGFLIVLAWLLGTLAGVLLQLWMLRTKITRKLDLQVLRLGTIVRYAAGNHLGDLAWSAPGLLFPLLVVGLLGAEANAYFYVAWAIAGLLAGIPTAVASSLLAEGSHSRGEATEHLRRAFELTLALVIPAIVVCWVAAPLLLALFGAPYEANGVETLRLLSLAALPLSINMLHLTAARVDRAIPRILVITAATGGGALILAAALAPAQGATGIALAYLAAHGVMAVALTAEWLLRGAAAP